VAEPTAAEVDRRMDALLAEADEYFDPYVREKFPELWLAAQHPDEDY